MQTSYLILEPFLLSFIVYSGLDYRPLDASSSFWFKHISSKCSKLRVLENYQKQPTLLHGSEEKATCVRHKMFRKCSFEICHTVVNIFGQEATHEWTCLLKLEFHVSTERDRERVLQIPLLLLQMLRSIHGQNVVLQILQKIFNSNSNSEWK